jgi:hypothetical protein
LSTPSRLASDLRITITATLCIMLSACGGQPSEEVAPEAPLGYQPFAASYEGVTRARIEQTYNELTDVNELGMRYDLTVEVAPAATPFPVTLRLDSISDAWGFIADSLPARLDSARGAAYTAALAPTGQLLDFAGGDSAGSLASELADRLLQSFFPRIPASGLLPGTQWTDTLVTTASLGGVENTVRSLREHHATGWTSYVARPALHIVTNTTYSFTGSGVQVGQPFTLEGEGRRHTHHYVTRDGIFLGLVSADTARAEAHLSDAGITIPILQTRVDTLAIMP